MHALLWRVVFCCVALPCLSSISWTINVSVSIMYVYFLACVKGSFISSLSLLSVYV